MDNRNTPKEKMHETATSLLNEIAVGNTDIAEVLTLGLTARDFDSETHRLVFRGMERLHERGEPIDPLSLCSALEGVQRPDGGAWSQYIMNVMGVALPLDNIAYHVQQVKESARQRWLGVAGYRLHEAAERGDSERIQKLTEKIAEIQSIGMEADTRSKCITLAHHDPKPKPWVIEGLIPDGFPSMIYGAGGMGKSFLSAHLGIEACRGGQSFMGHSFPREPLNTLIIDYELDADVQADRVRKIARGLNTEIPENLHYYAPVKAAARALPEFRGLIKRHGIRFAVIDSWGGAGVDGGNPEDTTAFLTELRNLGIATLILDHQAKVQTGESYDHKTAFGSVYKFNLCRSVFQLSKIGEGKNPMTLQLRHKKSNFGPLVDDLVLDVCFEGDRVLFTQSSAPNPDERDFELIGEAMVTLGADGAKVNQQALTEHLRGVIAKNRLHDLLKKGNGSRWQVTRGERNEMLYESSFPVSRPLSNRETGKLEIGNNDGLPPPPDELY